MARRIGAVMPASFLADDQSITLRSAILRGRNRHRLTPLPATRKEIRKVAHERLLGRKALSINLSDVAAMGGVGRHALVSLCLPPELEGAWVEQEDNSNRTWDTSRSNRPR